MPKVGNEEALNYEMDGIKEGVGVPGWEDLYR